ncbi:MAG: helicase-related protein [Bryobacterales bacterium]|nr:helicase-related protein [Bryobacterales bacterium]
MTNPRRNAEKALSALKDFQRRTVDYVFKRMWEDDPPAHRFLVADEVGLGKTLVARGIVAKTLEHLWDRVGRIDVVYICSNASIAHQNVSRLNVGGLPHAVLPTRLTLLPAHVRNLDGNKVNFISLTPGTSLNTTKSNRGGILGERLVLWEMLKQLTHPRDEAPITLTRPTKVAPPRTSTARPCQPLPSLVPTLNRDGLYRLLQCRVSDGSYEWHMRYRLPSVDTALTDAFLGRLLDDRKLYDDLLSLCERFADRGWADDQYAMVGDLRRMLASVCIEALEPDLIILDEFQRFRDLLNSNSRAGHLTKQILDFKYRQDAPEAGLRARVLLLSATPYKMLTLYGDEGEDHYSDFLCTCSFLCDEDEDVMRGLCAAIRRYRLGLLDGQSRIQDLPEARRDLEARLLRFMVRTERVRVSAEQDAMLEQCLSNPPLRTEDLRQAQVIDRVAATVNARDPIEYWKSAPYLLNVMRRYRLKDRFMESCDDPPIDLAAAVRDSEAWLLKQEAVEQYGRISPANPRLRQLLGDTVEQDQWKWLWMPPSLPYLEPGSPYAGDVVGSTKSLVFSSWVVVPDAIAAFCSYEADRRMLAKEPELPKYSDLHRSRARLLDFRLQDDRPSAMNNLLLLYPSPTLAELGDPLRLALERGGGPVPVSEALERVKKRIRQRFSESSTTSGLSIPDGESGTADQKWYWAGPALLDGARYSDTATWVDGVEHWLPPSEKGSDHRGLAKHVAEFRRVMTNRPDLGTPPDDLVEILAIVALAGPGVCAHRALRRITNLDPTHPTLLSGAARVAQGLRSTFNMPENTALIRTLSSQSRTRYWELVLRHALAGNLQAVLDEYAHTLEESLGLMGHTTEKVAKDIASEMLEALSIRTSPVRMDNIHCTGPSAPIEINPFNIRTRFALRFGDLRDERGESIQRADSVRKAFNSPFRPFILASTSIGQEGLDFHTYCHAVYHWNLPHNPVDLEQREGRVHRYKGHAVRKNVAECYGLGRIQTDSADGLDPWKVLFQRAKDDRDSKSNDLIPYWISEKGSARVQRRVPLLPFSQEVDQLRRLVGSLAVYRLAFGQPRQQDLVEYLRGRRAEDANGLDLEQFRISLQPPDITAPNTG